VRKINRVTIKDVATLANTSVATVSYVLNNSQTRYITPAMRKTVEDAARDLGYVKSMVASGLKGKKMGVISFLTPQFDNHFFMEIFFAIERIANRKGYTLTVCNTFDDPVHERIAIERMSRLWVDACLVIPTHKGAENSAYLRAHKIPVVSIERPLTGTDDKYDFISSDNFGAAYDMTEYLIKNGHTRIAIAYWESLITNLGERLEGYRQALKDYGIGFDESLVKRTTLVNRTEDSTQGEGYRLTQEILQDPTVTAVFYSQYVLAEGGIKYMRQHKIQIPGDMSVGVLGGPKWVEMSEVKFAHIMQPGALIGEKAAEIIFAKLEGESPGFVQEKIPCTLYPGDSVRDLTNNG